MAQGWSTTLPRWGPRVRIPSRALILKIYQKSCWQSSKDVIIYKSCWTTQNKKNFDNWTVKYPWKILREIQRTAEWKLCVAEKKVLQPKAVKTKVRRISQNDPGTNLNWEFDPGSGWTLAACLTHASRTKHLHGIPSGRKRLWLSGGRVSNAWITCLTQGDNS